MWNNLDWTEPRREPIGPVGASSSSAMEFSLPTLSEGVETQPATLEEPILEGCLNDIDDLPSVNTLLMADSLPAGNIISTSNFGQKAHLPNLSSANTIG